jgi:flagellum-specific peptidoglycan hydrolase FlgJ
MALGIAAGALRIGSMLGKSGGVLKKAVLKRTKVKRENIARRNLLNKRIVERRKRRDKESLLEAMKSKGKSGMSSIPGKSFLQRVLDFVGVLFVGWLVNNLPKIIEMVKEIIRRIKLLVKSLQSFISNLTGWFGSLGSLLTGTLDNLRNFDFTDQSGKIKKAMEGMESAFRGMQSDIEGMKNAVSGEQTSSDSGGAPVTGTDAEKYKQFYDMAKEAGAKYPELVAAQFALESGYGSSISGANNYFGLKATGSESGATMGTTEYYGGVKTGTSAKFMNFGSAQESVNTLVNRWYKDYGSYKGVNRASNAQEAADQLQQQGYATDPRYSQKLKDIMRSNRSVVGSGDGRLARGKNQTPAYQRAVNVGRALEGQGYRAWQHPDFNVYSGYTGSGRERVMRRSYNSYHNYGEALDYPLSWRTSGHYDHLHVSFKGGGSIDRMPVAGMDMGAGVGQPQNTIVIIEEEAPPMMMSQSGGGGGTVIMGQPLNSIITKQFLTSLAYT